jgi:hypothetical protein
MPGDFRCSNQARIYTEGFREFEPLGMPCQVGLGLGEVQGTAAFEPDIGANAFIHRTPSFERFNNEGDLTRIPALLAAPTPVTGGLLPTNFTFLTERDRYTSFSQGKCCGDTDDASAYDDNPSWRRGK